MKRFLLGAVGLVALGMGAPASAADLAARPYTKAPPPIIEPMYNWSGFYIGLNAGGGSSHKCWDLIPGDEGCHDATGGTVGGQLGYRWQMASWVFGFESQGDWASLKGSNVSLVTGNTNRSRIDDFGLFTGQLGYAWNTALLYFKGGAAIVADRNDLVAANGALIATSSGDNRWGGTVGAGIEFSFAPNWSAAVEYNHLFITNNNTTFTNQNTGAVISTDHLRGDANLVSVRVNYRWGGPVVGKY